MKKDKTMTRAIKTRIRPALRVTVMFFINNQHQHQHQHHYHLFR